MSCVVFRKPLELTSKKKIRSDLRYKKKWFSNGFVVWYSDKDHHIFSIWHFLELNRFGFFFSHLNLFNKIIILNFENSIFISNPTQRKYSTELWGFILERLKFIYLKLPLMASDDSITSTSTSKASVKMKYYSKL